MDITLTETIGTAIEVLKNVMQVHISDYEVGLRQMLEAAQSTGLTATGNIVLTDSSQVIQFIDPGGSTRTITLPAVSIDNHGFLIFNTADADGELLNVVDANSNPVATIYRNGAGWIISSGAAWRSAGLGTTNIATKRVAHWRVIPNTDAISTGDGKDYFVIPSELNGYNLVDVQAAVDTVSSSGAPLIQVRNATDSVDVLSTRITIDANEYTSYTAAAAPVIDTSKDDVATGDRLAADIDGAGTGTKGLVIILTFQLP